MSDSYRLNSVARVYYEELLHIGLGMALWKADPYDSIQQYTQPYEPGDIGFLT